MGFFPIRLTLQPGLSERCLSGLKSTLGKRVCRKLYRGFESRSLRHSTRCELRFFTCSWQAISENRILWTIRYQASNALSQSMDIARSNSPLRKRSLYIGQTNNVAKRLERHKHGSGARHNLQLKQCNLVIVEGPLEREGSTVGAARLEMGHA